MSDGANLLGYKGTSVLNAGYVYAPYIPLQHTPYILTIFDIYRDKFEKRSHQYINGPTTINRCEVLGIVGLNKHRQIIEDIQTPDSKVYILIRAHYYSFDAIDSRCILILEDDYHFSFNQSVKNRSLTTDDREMIDKEIETYMKNKDEDV